MTTRWQSGTGAAMATEYICDVCGKREPGIRASFGTWLRPPGWGQTGHQQTGRVLDVCSWPCWERAKKQRGKGEAADD